MSGPCNEFRAALERALLGRVQADEMRALEWHEHLLGCGACRDLLEAEQALEELLASLPEPRLPADVTQRVLARLRARREADEAALDALLALDEPAVPGGLARGVLEGLAGARTARGGEDDAALERLLDRYDVDVPTGLAFRVRGALAAARVAAPRPFLTRAGLAAIAAGLLVALGLWLWEPVKDDGQVDLDELAQADDEPELELLEELAVLEQLDALEAAGDDLDLLLTMELGPADELLLAYDEDELGDVDAEGEPR